MDETQDDQLETLHQALEEENFSLLGTQLADLHPAEIANLLESLPPAQRDEIWEILDASVQGEVLAETEDAVRTPRMLQMAPSTLAAIARDVDDDDAVDMLQDLPDDVIVEVLRSMDAQHRERLEAILAYPEDTAGGLMNLDVLTVRADVTLEVVARYLRLIGDIPEKTNRLFIVDREGRYAGHMRLADLITRDPDLEVSAIMDRDESPVPATMPEDEVARLFETRNLISAPVVDDDGLLLGRITIDDVVDVIRDQGDHSLLGMAGLDEDDDLFAPVLETSKRRTLWLAINLATALLAAWVIGLFQATIEELVALAVLMPVVASMGGIAGSQTLTVVIRGLAVGQIVPSNTLWLVLKELRVGLINSLCWAVVVGVVASWWFANVALGVVVGVALVVNLVVASIAGAAVPLVLRRLAIDPALAGGVILTTVTDVVGFMAFLGLGAAVLVS